MKRGRLKFSLLLAGVLAVVFFYFNSKYEVFALHPFGGKEGDLRVLTFNIHSLGEDFDCEQIADLVLKENADVVLLNEFDDSTGHRLDSLMLLRYAYTEGSRTGTCQDLLYSRLPIDDWTWVKESGFPTLMHSCRVKVKDGYVRLLVCHLSSNNKEGQTIETATEENSSESWKDYYAGYRKSQESRLREMNLMRNHLDTIPPLPTIVMGDMNDFSCSRTLQPLLERGLKDAWWEGGFGYGATYKYKYLRLRIDHVLYTPKAVMNGNEQLGTDRSGLKLTGVKVVDSGKLSDHNMLVADFELEEYKQ